MKYFLGGTWVDLPTAQGFSPSAKVTRVSDGAVIKITDKDGTTEVKVRDGSGSGGGAAIVEVDELPDEGEANTIYALKVDEGVYAPYIYLDDWCSIGTADTSATDEEVINLFL